MKHPRHAGRCGRYILVVGACATIFLLACCGDGGGPTPDPGSLLWSVTTNPSATGSDVLTAIAVDPTGLYLVGDDYSPGEPQWRMEKRSLADGSLIPAFGTYGVAASNPSASVDRTRAVALDSTSLYVAGFDDSPAADDHQWRIEKRNLTDGSLVAGFGAGGLVTNNPSVRWDLPLAVVVDSTGLYLAGSDSIPANYQWRLEKRSLTDGSPVAAFGTDGVITSNPSNSNDAADALALDSASLYVVGYDRSPGASDTQWRIEKRNLTDGSLAAAFGTDGVVMSNPSASPDAAAAVAMDSTSLYLVGYDHSAGNNQWRIEKRSKTDGALVTAFGTFGVVTSNPSTLDDSALGVAIDSTGLYVVGYDTSPGTGDSQWRIEKRSLTEGSPIVDFGTGGVVTSNPTTGDDRAYAVAMDSTGIYVAGVDYSSGYYQWRIEKFAK